MDRVKAWEEKVTIPTYRTGAPDRNPMFLEKRVYQGSSGVVYPHPVVDKVFDEKTDQQYTALFLENEFLKIMVLPELGGRIQMAYDKTNDYHFIYYNQVIKPALVGLTGPWISGGIEFNWPQHHRPSTFEPVDFTITENEDGSATVWVSEIEIMFHTKGMAGYTLYPGKAYLEVTGKLYNRTPFPQTFLWWANPAVQVDEHYQSVFPPDVHAVYDHGRRDVSSFPIATGTYYKVDYSPGTDISRYQHIPVPTSYMAVDSHFNFVGGYHHQKKAGILHVADHHISPGKKQWTWGSGDFGKMWDKQLTDEDGPYFELMTGVYTDNQPDFSWIMPNEERVFHQYFFPYKEAGYIRNANRDAAVNLEVAEGKATVRIYVTSDRPDLRVILSLNGEHLLEEQVHLSPVKTFAREISLSGTVRPEDLLLEVTLPGGASLIRYHPPENREQVIPDPAKPIGKPATLKTLEDLYLAALHLEQYRHATYSPVDYYEEALRRDPTDIRCNNGMGRWLLTHGQFLRAEPFLRRAIEKLSRHNPNPYDGEPYYNLGLCLSFQERWEEAYDAFFKSCWNAAWQDNGYFELACIDCRRGDLVKALEHVDHSLARNHHGMKARHLKAMILRKLGQSAQAESLIHETLSIDAFDFGSRYELIWLLRGQDRNKEAHLQREQLLVLTRMWEHSFLEIANDYAHAGFYEEALYWMNRILKSSNPMVHYYAADFYFRTGKLQEMEVALTRGASLSPERVFPNRLEDIGILGFVIAKRPEDKKALFYLGNLWYDKRQYGEAVACWERSIAIGDPIPTVLRNLGIACFNKLDRPKEALSLYERAFQADPSDARVLFELDQLYKKLNRAPRRRLAFLEKQGALVKERDDLYIEYVTLYNLLGRHGEAETLLASRHFHPWEGGEGKVSRQYVQSKISLAQAALKEGKEADAVGLLKAALHYPDNLGEGKLYGAQENDIFFWLGCAYHQQGNGEEAETSWKKAAEGLSEPAPAIYYNDQPPESIFYQGLSLEKLGQPVKARKRFDNLIGYGEQHMKDKIAIDFFAVSLPDLMVFDTDLDERNRIHCHYLIGLGLMGSGDQQAAESHFKRVIKMDAAHQGAVTHLAMLASKTLSVSQ